MTDRGKVTPSVCIASPPIASPRRRGDQPHTSSLRRRPKRRSGGTVAALLLAAAASTLAVFAGHVGAASAALPTGAGVVLNAPIVDVASTPSGRGYWEVGADGGIFTFGRAGYYGSTGSLVLNKPIVGMESGPGGRGYWEVASRRWDLCLRWCPVLRVHRIDPAEPAHRGHRRHSRTGSGYWMVASRRWGLCLRGCPLLRVRQRDVARQPDRRHGLDPRRPMVTGKLQPAEPSTPSGTPASQANTPSGQSVVGDQFERRRGYRLAAQIRCRLRLRRARGSTARSPVPSSTGRSSCCPRAPTGT